MHIRAEQLNKLTEAQQERFFERVTVFFRESAPDLCADFDAATLRRVLTVARARAEYHGVTSTPALIRFMSLALLVGPDFDRDAKIVRFLQMDVRDIDFRVNLLADLVTEQIRHRARS